MTNFDQDARAEKYSKVIAPFRIEQRQANAAMLQETIRQLAAGDRGPRRGLANRIRDRMSLRDRPTLRTVQRYVRELAKAT